MSKQLPPIVYSADNRATALDILEAINLAFKQYKQAFADDSEIIRGFSKASDILDYNEQHPDNPIPIVRVEYQHHEVKPAQVTLFDELARGWL